MDANAPAGWQPGAAVMPGGSLKSRINKATTTIDMLQINVCLAVADIGDHQAESHATSAVQSSA